MQTTSTVTWGGATASERFVHALAATLATTENTRVVTLVHGPRKGVAVRRTTIKYRDLRNLIGNALAESTIKSLISRHTHLFWDGSHDRNWVYVDLPEWVQVSTDAELMGESK